MKVAKGQHILKKAVTDAYGVAFSRGSSVVKYRYYDRFPPGVSIQKWSKVDKNRRVVHYLDRSLGAYVYTHVVASTHSHGAAVEASSWA